MAVHDQRSVTPEEYLALERAAERKSEYRDGEIVGMTGGTRRHSLITLNIGSELNRQLAERPCEAHVNDLRVLVAARRLYTYPDVIVVCGEPALADRYRDTLPVRARPPRGRQAAHAIVPPGLRLSSGL